jgi:hypothetical protein
MHHSRTAVLVSALPLPSSPKSLKQPSRPDISDIFASRKSNLLPVGVINGVVMNKSKAI